MQIVVRSQVRCTLLVMMKWIRTSSLSVKNSFSYFLLPVSVFSIFPVLEVLYVPCAGVRSGACFLCWSAALLIYAVLIVLRSQVHYTLVARLQGHLPAHARESRHMFDSQGTCKKVMA